MKPPVLGVVWSPCHRCDQRYHGIVSGFVHDVRCWSWRTAFINLWDRFAHPDYFEDC